MTLLSIKNFSLAFGPARIINNISLDIAPGEMLAVVGESGSGKSLTALSCLGLQPAGATVSGQITLDGKDIIGASPALLRSMRGKVATMIFQEPMTALNPLHTIGKQLAEMYKSCGPRSGSTGSHENAPDPVRQASLAHRIEMLLEEVGLTHLAERLGAYPHELSGGERQRVMIAMAIANDPKLLIADEPTTAVDVTIQKKILELLKRLQKDRGMAILFITHDLTVVKRLADRVAVMKSGEIVEQGKVADIFASPQHDYTRMLLASEPKGSAAPSPTNAKTLLECQALKVYFPIKSGLLRRIKGYIKAVDDISIDLSESSSLGIVGESGSGKSTLGFAVLRLRLLKSEGKILWLGNDIAPLSSAAMRPLRKDMQLVFQDPFGSLNPRMTVEQIIGEGLLVHEPHRETHPARIAQILSEVGLSPEMAHRYPHEFSGGQRQRIAIARAMVLQPKLVVLDEPTSALDLTVQRQITELLKKFQAERGISYIFISHDLRVVRAVAHNIAVLYKGKIVEYGPTRDILQNPKQDYTKRLIDAAML